jgi:hypothetical protein
VSVRIGMLQSDCLANEIDRHVIAPGLMGNDAQQVQSLGMLGLGGQDLAIRRFGQSEAAGSMFSETALQQIGQIKASRRIRPASLIAAPSLIGERWTRRSRSLSFSCCRSALLPVHAGNPQGHQQLVSPPMWQNRGVFSTNLLWRLG